MLSYRIKNIQTHINRIKCSLCKSRSEAEARRRELWGDRTAALHKRPTARRIGIHSLGLHPPAAPSPPDLLRPLLAAADTHSQPAHCTAPIVNNTNTYTSSNVPAALQQLSAAPCFRAGAAAAAAPEAEAAQLTGPSYAALLWRNRRVTAFCLALAVLQQLSGVNVIIFYSSSIFAASGERPSRVLFVCRRFRNESANLIFLVE